MTSPHGLVRKISTALCHRNKCVQRCRLPITAPGAVKLVATDLGLFEITPAGFKLTEHAPGWTPDDIQNLTEAKLIIAEDLKVFRLRDVTIS